jgi:hypothetical protein
MGLFSKDIKNMDDLFVHTLRDIYYAEKQIVKALPEMVGKASDPQLKQGFKTHLRETENHLGRLEQVFKLIDTPAKGVDCPAIDGIIEEANEVAAEVESTPVLDARSDRRRPSRRTLRDDALWHADLVGQATWSRRLRCNIATDAR